MCCLSQVLVFFFPHPFIAGAPRGNEPVCLPSSFLSALRDSSAKWWTSGSGEPKDTDIQIVAPGEAGLGIAPSVVTLSHPAH